MTAGPCEPADTLAVERVILAPAKHRVGAGHGGRRSPHAARFSARIGPKATSEAELFRSPCQRISLLVHERFRPVHGSGVDQVGVAMRPRIYRQGSPADAPERRGLISLTFSGVVPAVTIRGLVSIIRHQPEGSGSTSGIKRR
jgi:hypothetical protein